MKGNFIKVKKIIQDFEYKDGYIQYFDEKVKKFDGEIKKEFIELALCNDKESIFVKYLDGIYFVDITKLEDFEIEVEEYISELGGKVKIGKVFEFVNDPFCENFKTKKLKKLVYLGEGELNENAI